MAGLQFRQQHCDDDDGLLDDHHLLRAIFSQLAQSRPGKWMEKNESVSIAQSMELDPVTAVKMIAGQEQLHFPSNIIVPVGAETPPASESHT